VPVTEFSEPLTTFVKVYENIGFDRSVKKLDQSLWVCEIVFCADERSSTELKSKFNIGWLVVVALAPIGVVILAVLFVVLGEFDVVVVVLIGDVTAIGADVVTVVFEAIGTIDDAVVIGTVVAIVGVCVVTVVLVLVMGRIVEVVTMVGDANVLVLTWVGRVRGNVGAIVAELSVLSMIKISRMAWWYL